MGAGKGKGKGKAEQKGRMTQWAGQREPNVLQDHTAKGRIVNTQATRRKKGIAAR